QDVQGAWRQRSAFRPLSATHPRPPRRVVNRGRENPSAETPSPRPGAELSHESSAARLQPADVRALGLERRANDPGPAGGLAFERAHHRTCLLVVAPDQDAGPSAGDRGAEGPERGGPFEQLDRAGVEVGPVRLVEAVLKARRYQLHVRARQAEDQGCRLGNVEYGV